MSKTKIIYGPYGWVVGSAEDVQRYGECCWAENDSKSKRKVILLFDRESLLYDIANIAYVEGDVMQADDPHDKHQVIDITQDGNVDRVTRLLDLAHATCVDYLYPYTKIDVEDGTELDDLFAEADTYRIEMSVPKAFSATTAKLLEQLIHEYMVAYVLCDWLSVTYPAASEKWAAKAQGLLEEVKRKVNSRTGVLTRPLRPF